MQLTLKYKEQATHVLSGAFIRGNTPDLWLQEINAWQLPVEKLVCFIIAQNNNPADAAGLFVIFNRNQQPGMLQVRHPYTVLGKKLFIPVNAELSPAISEQELQSLLIWDYQVFHPTIGFIGFERSDRINLADLLQYREPRNIYWGYARQGLQPWIPLRQISVQQLTAQDVFDSFKEHISNKPLDEIPPSNKGEVPGWLNNPIASGIFKGVYSFISGLNSKTSAGSKGSSGSSAGSEGGNSGQLAGNSGQLGGDDKKPGLFKKILNWMEQKIEDLERQRDSELKRLSDMFDKDTDEALKYAIPLNSPYAGRGTAPPSARLGKRSTEFNLNKLGGGQAGDGWDVDNYYNELQAKYLKAAQKAIEEKDYKKAAYIYAHLLGDFTSAADMLRRGKFFREAAVLYQEHLRNPAMAAICYEEGGLLMEAIDIYTELNQHEKAGDLYRELDMEEPALGSYEKCVEAAAANKDYLEESRIIIDKIGDTPRAKQVLLNGWQDIKQPEACLVKYFDLVADKDKEQMHSVVKTFYANTQVVNKEMAFLNVIDKVNRKYKTPELENACQGIAYEIVSEQVSAGNPDSVFALRNFVPGDKLLSPDLYRFLHAVTEAPKQKPAPDKWQLMKGAAWQKALVWKNQLLIWGVQSRGYILARMNWDGHVEYFTWERNSGPNISWFVLADAESTNHIIAYTGDEMLAGKLLPKNSHFQEALNISCPGFLPPHIAGLGIHKGDLMILHFNYMDPALSRYSLHGGRLAYRPCINGGEGTVSSTARMNEMLRCGDHFFLANENNVCRISDEGVMDLVYAAPAKINKVIVQRQLESWAKIVFSFDDRVVILKTHNRSRYQEDPVMFEVKGEQVVDITFLADEYIAMAGRHDVQILDPLGNIERRFETQNDVIALFPGPKRDQLGVLESTGKITLHKTKE